MADGYALRYGYIKNELKVMANAAITAETNGKVITTTAGDLIYQNNNTTDRLPIGAADRVLVSNGTDPTWGTVNLSSSSAVTGTLPVARGGTNATSFTGDRLIASDVAGTTLVSTASPVIDTIRSNASGNPVVLDIIGSTTDPDHISVDNGAGVATVSAAGTSANINVSVKGKGTGNVLLGNANLSFPNTPGAPSQVLSTDGVGVLSFIDVPVYETGDVTTSSTSLVSVPGASIPTLVSSSMYQAQVRVVAKEVGSPTNYAAFNIHASFFVNGSGAVIKVSEDNEFSPSTTNLEAYINVVGSAIITQVKSDTTNDVKWHARLSYDVVSD